MRRRLSWIRRGAILVPLLMLVSTVITFFSLPFLLAPGEVVRADCIIHAATDARLNSDEFVAKLYSDGVASKIVCAGSQASRELYPADFACEHLISLGVRPQDVATLRLPLVECGALNRPLLIEHLRKNGWKSALFVADPSITRLSRSLMIRDFRKAGIEIAVTFAPADREVMLDKWWRTHWKAQRVVLGNLNSTLDLLYPSCW